jgi:hypothetical protein
MSYPVSQQMLLAIVPKFTGTIGMTSALLLMTEIIRDYRKNDMNPMKRALFCSSCFEWMDAFGWFLSTWALPNHTDFVWATGSWTTCNFQGFCLQASIGAPLCQCMLTYTFYRMSRPDAQTWDYDMFEWIMYSAVLIYTFSATTLLLILDQLNPTNQVCVANGYPLGCSEAVFGTNDIPCERGFNAHIFGLATFYIVLWIAFITIMYLNIVMRRRLLSSQQASESTDVQWITTQALLYGVAFVVTWTPSTMWFVFPLFGYFRFWLDFLPGVLEPLQGLWSLLIFIRNRPESIERIQRLIICRNSDFLLNHMLGHHQSTPKYAKDSIHTPPKADEERSDLS